MARKKDPALEAQRRTQLLAATVDLLADRPFHALTQKKLAEHVGVSKGMVTYYFPTKDALLQGAIDHYLEQQTALLFALVEQPTDARTKLRMLIAAAFPSAESALREVSFQSEVLSYAKQHPAIRESVAASYRAFRDACARLLDEGKEAGLVTVEDRDWAYLFVHALMDGLTLQLVVQPDLDLDALRSRAETVILSLVRPA